MARTIDVPGRCPQDAQIACALLAYVMTGLQGTPSAALLGTLHARGVDTREARQMAHALTGLALRLGAWLGSNENSPAMPVRRGVDTAQQLHEGVSSGMGLSKGRT